MGAENTKVDKGHNSVFGTIRLIIHRHKEKGNKFYVLNVPKVAKNACSNSAFKHSKMYEGALNQRNTSVF